MDVTPVEYQEARGIEPRVVVAHAPDIACIVAPTPMTNKPPSSDSGSRCYSSHVVDMFKTVLTVFKQLEPLVCGHKPVVFVILV